eukprot:TRINITY_DN1389_c0_g1_i1.p1 TRINITY_DN1389_c0_g1~~TRINITY_DN1389_c0_g1_i1.p1  ORF type:complete len:256 (+),score=48.25 TRINITY_DN1389_c0_g1_i1:250-1017(+)
MGADIILDTQIRDWVLVPITLVMFLIGVLRHYMTQALQSEKIGEPKTIRESQSIMRARFLRANAGYIPATSFRMRRAYFNNKETGLLVQQKKDAPNAGAQMMQDPSFAVNMMKNNLSYMLPQSLTFAWISFFFSGFVAAKIPFPLTQRFRSMLQRGIELGSLDVTYVSSQSWYFLNLFGLRGVFSLVLGEGNAGDDTQKMMQAQMMGMGGGLGPDAAKAFQAETDALELTQHEWILPQIEQHAEETLRRVLRERG